VKQELEKPNKLIPNAIFDYQRHYEFPNYYTHYFKEYKHHLKMGILNYYFVYWCVVTSAFWGEWKGWMKEKVIIEEISRYN
jgi:hypothetical protein